MIQIIAKNAFDINNQISLVPTRERINPAAQFVNNAEVTFK
jgi:hypothetical protein